MSDSQKGYSKQLGWRQQLPISIFASIRRAEFHVRQPCRSLAVELQPPSVNSTWWQLIRPDISLP